MGWINHTEGTWRRDPLGEGQVCWADVWHWTQWFPSPVDRKDSAGLQQLINKWDNEWRESSHSLSPEMATLQFGETIRVCRNWFPTDCCQDLELSLTASLWCLPLSHSHDLQHIPENLHLRQDRMDGTQVFMATTGDPRAHFPTLREPQGDWKDQTEPPELGLLRASLCCDRKFCRI